MSKKNFIDSETRNWRTFEYGGQSYNLSHLNAHEASYTELRNNGETITYTFIVTYSCHCFTTSKSGEGIGLYKAPRESRPFDLRRYTLSKYLKAIVESLGSTPCFHASYRNYATYELYDVNGLKVEYKVVFKAYRSHRKLRLHVLSAYPLDIPDGSRKKVSFFTIAYNTLRNKKLPTPGR